MTIKIKEFKGSLNPIFNESNIIDLGTESETSLNESTNDLSINLIKPREDQPRKIFNESALEELTQSIKSKGVIQPIIVQRTNNGFYEIIAGERRFRAAKRAGLEKIPAVIRDYSKSDRMAVALIENIQRENLNPLEEAQAIHCLLEECSMTHHQVAESLGKSRTTVSNLLRLLSLTEEVKKMINSGLLEMGHARALLSLTAEQQIEAANLIVGKKLSVRETEKFVQRINMPQEKQSIYIDLVIERKAETWKMLLSRKLSSKVNFQFDLEGNGKIIIHFDSIKKADWLMDHIGFTETEEVE